MACLAEYFKQLFKIYLPSGQLQTTGLQVMFADPPINGVALSIDEVQEAATNLRDGKEACICNINAELLKGGGEAMIRGLHAVLTAV